MGVNFEDILDDFLKFLRYEKGFSFNTLKSYKMDLIDFLDYVEKIGIKDVSEVDYSLLSEYITYLGMKKKLKPSSIERKIASLKTLFRFLLRQKIISNNPADLISSPKKEKRFPVVLEKGEIFELIFSIPEDNAMAVRNKTIIMLLYASGLRVSELTKLNLKDLDLKQGVVHVLGKGNKYRIVPLGKKTKEMLLKYLVYRKEFKSVDDSLFITRSGKRIQDRMIRYILTGYINKLAIQKRVSPHTIRHTFATHLLDSGANIRVIQEMLGHSSLSTTQIYTHLSIEKLKKSYAEFHPHA